MHAEAERMTGGTGVHREPFGAARVVGRALRWLEETPSERLRQLPGGLQVVDVEVDVNLLLLGTVRPDRWFVIGRELHAHHPLAIDDDAVPVVVAVDLAAEQAGPEGALGLEVPCVEHDDPSDDLHRRAACHADG